MGITIYESDLEAGLVPDNDYVFMTATIGEFSINRILVEKEVPYSYCT